MASGLPDTANRTCDQYTCDEAPTYQHKEPVLVNVVCCDVAAVQESVTRPRTSHVLYPHFLSNVTCLVTETLASVFRTHVLGNASKVCTLSLLELFAGAIGHRAAIVVMAGKETTAAAAPEWEPQLRSQRTSHEAEELWLIEHKGKRSAMRYPELCAACTNKFNCIINER